MQHAKISWRDNQPYSEDFSDIFFSREGGRAESEYVFLKNNDLPQRWLQADRFVIGETGFGTGLNAFLALLEVEKSDLKIEYTTLELYPLSQEAWSQLNYPEILASASGP